jgi:hypothetical protein
MENPAGIQRKDAKAQRRKEKRSRQMAAKERRAAEPQPNGFNHEHLTPEATASAGEIEQKVTKATKPEPKRIFQPRMDANRREGMHVRERPAEKTRFLTAER